jgi:hypothetical protein
VTLNPVEFIPTKIYLVSPTTIIDESIFQTIRRYS